MAIEGSLREFAVEDIFQLMHLSRKTGELVIVREPSRVRGSVLFDAGAVVRAVVDGPSPHLGHLLLNAGKITEADLARAEERQVQSPDQSWVEIINSMDVVSEEDVEKHVHFQAQELIIEILDWQDGSFSFAERAIDELERTTWIPTESLLMESARRADELSALPTAVASNDAVPRLCDGAGEGGILDLLPEEWEVLGQIDGERDLRAIAWALGRSEFEVSKVVSKLVDEELLEIGGPDIGRARPPHELALDHAEELITAGEFKMARERIDRVLRDRSEESRALYLHSLMCERAGDLEAAATGYETTLSADPLAAEARLRLGLVRLKLGNLEGATREWTAYLRMSQDSPERRRVERAMSAARELEVALNELDGRDA